MRILVFALMVETLNSGVVVETEEFGLFRDIYRCTHFAKAISMQAGGQWDIPIRAFCKPMWIDKDTDKEIF
ncbi:hypothetical protein [uncultured Mediterranean phage uvMED]|nr:hypothetical protein [uncultured Mediterranean phage uvMED]